VLRRRADAAPVVAAFVVEGADVLRGGELETVPGPGARSPV